jgi:hypothetical protein
MQFLAVGRSVDRIGDGSTRYKMTRQKLLPKFGSASKRAGPDGLETPEIVPSATAKLRAPQSPAAERPVATGEPLSPLKFAAAKTVRPGILRRALLKLGIVKQVMTEEPGPSSRVAEPKRRSGFFKNPFARGTKPWSELRVVQTELRLDAVKPVRNDLSDTDLEVVASRPCSVVAAAPSAAGPANPISSAGGPASPEEPAWGRARDQVFGAGKP